MEIKEEERCKCMDKALSTFLLVFLAMALVTAQYDAMLVLIASIVLVMILESIW